MTGYAIHRVNRVLYGLAFASMLGLLIELGFGSRSSELDVARSPSTTPAPVSSSARAEAVTSGAPPAEPAVAATISLADIAAEVSTRGAPDDLGGSNDASPAATGSARRPAEPSPPASSPSGDEPSPAAAQPAVQTPQPEQQPQTDPPATPASSSDTTPSTRVERTPGTVEVPDFDFLDPPDRDRRTRR